MNKLKLVLSIVGFIALTAIVSLTTGFLIERLATVENNSVQAFSIGTILLIFLAVQIVIINFYGKYVRKLRDELYRND